jgi:hypothetical protein
MPHLDAIRRMAADRPSSPPPMQAHAGPEDHSAAAAQPTTVLDTLQRRVEMQEPVASAYPQAGPRRAAAAAAAAAAAPSRRRTRRRGGSDSDPDSSSGDDDGGRGDDDFQARVLREFVAALRQDGLTWRRYLRERPVANQRAMLELGPLSVAIDHFEAGDFEAAYGVLCRRFWSLHYSEQVGDYEYASMFMPPEQTAGLLGADTANELLRRRGRRGKTSGQSGAARASGAQGPQRASSRRSSARRSSPARAAAASSPARTSNNNRNKRSSSGPAPAAAAVAGAPAH